jgi:HAD superfamily hydrolase (TIGR01484 family)
MKKALILDVDGTLVGAGGDIDTDIVDALQCVAPAIQIVLASGRPLFGVQKITVILKIDCPVIAFNGAVTSIPHVGVVERYPLPRSALLEIWNTVLTAGRYQAIFVYGEHYWAAFGDEIATAEEAAIIGRAPLIRVASIPNEPALDLGQIYKVSVICLDVDAWTRQARSPFDKRSTEWNASRSSPRYVEFVADAVSKAHGVQILRRHLGFSYVVSVGDGYNDLSLFDVSDRSYAMSWAPLPIRKRASATLPSSRALALLIRSLISDKVGC